MSSEQVSISAQGLGKCYRLYATQRDRIRQLLQEHVLRRGPAAPVHYTPFWALQGLSLDVLRGETVGIIGRNGSGKSTLLQMICGTLAPTVGQVETRGRVAALLELGAGFNPEFTGRENVYMNAAILGLSKRQTDACFDEIAAFAEIGDFMDRPVKFYSSGMYARLAFAVAINVEPDILIVDEALAVGDEAFQRKCFARIEAIKRRGGSILFVSHSANAVLSLCDRVLLLHNGEMLYLGAPRQAMAYYQKLINAPAAGQAQVRNEILNASRVGAAGAGAGSLAQSAPATLSRPGFDPALVVQSMVRYEPDGACIESPRLLDASGAEVNVLVGGSRYRVEYKVRFERDFHAVRLRTLIKTVAGVELGGGTYPGLDEGGIAVRAGDQVTASFEFSCNLGGGMYFLNCGVAEGLSSIHRIIDALAFRVEPATQGFSFGVADFAFSTRIDSF